MRAYIFRLICEILKPSSDLSIFREDRTSKSCTKYTYKHKRVIIVFVFRYLGHLLEATWVMEMCIRLISQVMDMDRPLLRSVLISSKTVYH